MAYTAQLSDSVTTLDLVDGASYSIMAGGVSLTPPSPRRGMTPESLLAHGSAILEEKFSNRRVTLRLQLMGTSKDNLITNVRNIQDLLEKARARQITGFGNGVTLTLQWDSASNSFILDVMDGQLHYPPSLWSKTFLDLNNRIVDARLELLCKPFARRAAVSLSADTLENEQDSGTGKNYTDITSINGDMDAPAQIKLAPTGASGSQKTYIATRSGTRRTDILWRQGEGRDSFTSLETDADFSLTEATVVDANASDGNVSRSRLDGGGNIAKEFKGRLNFVLAGPPRGLFRVLARVKATASTAAVDPLTDTSFYLGWSFGKVSHTPTIGTVPLGADHLPTADDTYEVMDLGEIRILPTSEPDGQTLSDFELRIFLGMENAKSGVTVDTDWFVDYVFLLPADESVAIINNVGATDRILIDSQSPHPHIFILDSSDRVQGVADYVGRPAMISKQDSRIYILRADVPGVTFAFSGIYVPRYWDLA